MPDNETLEIFERECKNGMHPLTDIMKANVDGDPNEFMVAKWCPICGVVVVDAEYDGRVYPGKFTKAKKPKMLEE